MCIRRGKWKVVKALVWLLLRDDGEKFRRCLVLVKLIHSLSIFTLFFIVLRTSIHCNWLKVEWLMLLLSLGALILVDFDEILGILEYALRDGFILIFASVLPLRPNIFIIRVLKG